MMSVCWRVVSLKPLRFWSSDSYRAALSPDVFDGIFPRITGVFSHWYMRNKTHLNSVRKKKSLLSLVKRQWPFRSSQYKRKIWSLVKRIKLPHPSKAKRECHKSVNNPRRHLVDLTIYLGLSEKSVCGSLDESSITAASHTLPRAQKLPNMQVGRISFPMRSTERKII